VSNAVKQIPRNSTLLHERRKTLPTSTAPQFSLVVLIRAVLPAKNLVLAGVKSVTIHDTQNVEIADLGANFYLTPTDVGANRAEVSLRPSPPRLFFLCGIAPRRLPLLVTCCVLPRQACRAKLAELNGAVTVRSLGAQALEGALLAEYNAVVLCEAESLTERDRISNLCRESGVCLIVSQLCGLAGMLFVDFGASFRVLDKDGETPSTSMLACIAQDEAGTVTCLEGALPSTRPKSASNSPLNAPCACLPAYKDL